MKLAIGVVCRDFRSIGGFQSYTENLLFELADQGHEVFVLSATMPPLGLRKKIHFFVEPKINLIEEKVGEKIRRNRLSGKWLLDQSKSLSPMVQNFFDSIGKAGGQSVVLFISLHRILFLPLGLNVISECESRGIPLVSREASELHFFRYRKLESDILALPDVIVVPSKFMKRILVQKKVPANRIRVIANGVPEEYFFNKAKKTARKIFSSGQPVRILFPGRISSRSKGILWDKGIGDLVFAISKLSSVYTNVRLVLGGLDKTSKSSRSDCQQIRAFAKDCGIASRLRFLSLKDCTRAKFVRQYRLADIVVCNSQYPESYLNSAWEAMACAKPVISTERAVSLMEAAQVNAKWKKPVFSADDIHPFMPFVIVPLASPDVLADCLHRLISNPRLAGAIGKNGFRLASTRRIGLMTQKLVAVLDSRKKRNSKLRLNQFLANVKKLDFR